MMKKKATTFVVFIVTLIALYGVNIRVHYYNNNAMARYLYTREEPSVAATWSSSTTYSKMMSSIATSNSSSAEANGGLVAQTATNTVARVGDPAGEPALQKVVKDYWEPLERFTAPPSHWRQWLEIHYNNDSSHLSHLKTASVSGWGCGFSLQMAFPDSSHRAFFKAQHANMSYFDAESHLREIKASYLDRILGTNSTLPCVGHRMMVPAQRENATLWTNVLRELNCINPNSKDKYVEGSMMMWLEGLENIEREEIVKQARNRNENALNHVAFHYLGGCMKSEHNYFYYKKGNMFTAIDNDRCLTPEAISYAPNVPRLHFNRIQLWKQLTYELACHLPRKLQLFLQEAAAAAAADNNKLAVSDRLVEALRGDVLSQELLASQPEAFVEIDQRIHQLATYIHTNCHLNVTGDPLSGQA